MRRLKASCRRQKAVLRLVRYANYLKKVYRLKAEAIKVELSGPVRKLDRPEAPRLLTARLE